MESVGSSVETRASGEHPPSRAGVVTARWPGWLALRSRPWLQFLLAFVVLTVLLVLVRGNLLWTSGMQNPDEAELMAEGRGAAADLFPYSGYTTSTHLFLWPFVLGVLDLVGVPLTLVTAHVIGGLTYVLLGTTGWFLMMRRIGGVRAAFLILPTAMVLLLGYGAGTSDFLSMTSEALPLVILCIAALVLLGPEHPLTSRQLVVGSVVAGLSVWAKPQSGPLAVALVAACVFMACVEQHRDTTDGSPGAPVGYVAYVVRSGVVSLLAFAAPTVVLLGIMKLGGTLDEFVREPVAAMWGYTAHRDVSQGIVAPPLTDKLAGAAGFAGSFPWAAAWALGGLLAMSRLAGLRSARLRALAVTAYVLPLAVTLLSLLPIYPLFPHYANLMYGGCLLASCVAVRLVAPTENEKAGQGRWVEGTYFGISITVVVMLMLSTVPDQIGDLAGQARRAVTGKGFSFANEVDRDATPLGAKCPAGSRVIVWGWASELYAYYDWTPASRYVNTTWVLNPGEHQAEYGSVLEDELRQSPPDCIVEAIGPAFFAGIDPARTLGAVVPSASPFLKTCYTQTVEKTFDGRDVTLFHRKATCTEG